MRPRNCKYLCLGFPLLLAAAFLLATTPVGGPSRVASADEPAPAAAKAEEKAPGQTIALPGEIEASAQAKLVARVAGTVDRVTVEIGDPVKKDQILAVVRAPEIEAELRQKQALVVQAEAEVLRARQSLKAAEAVVERAEATAREAEAGLKRAQADHAR